MGIPNGNLFDRPGGVGPGVAGGAGRRGLRGGELNVVAVTSVPLVALDG